MLKSIKRDGVEITNSQEMADAFNTSFRTIGVSLANNLPNSDTNTFSYITPATGSFSFTEINRQIVTDVLKALILIRQLAQTIFLVES